MVERLCACELLHTVFHVHSEHILLYEPDCPNIQGHLEKMKSFHSDKMYLSGISVSASLDPSFISCQFLIYTFKHIEGCGLFKHLQTIHSYSQLDSIFIKSFPAVEHMNGRACNLSSH